MNHTYFFVGTEEQFLDRINGMNKVGSGVSVEYFSRKEKIYIIKSDEAIGTLQVKGGGSSSIDILMEYKMVDQNIFLISLYTRLRLESFFIGGMIFIIAMVFIFGTDALFSGIWQGLVTLVIGIAAIFFFNLIHKVQEETLIEKAVKLLKLKDPSEGRTTEL